MDSVDQDQIARSVQSGLDLHCPRKFLVASTVGKELNCNFLHFCCIKKKKVTLGNVEEKFKCWMKWHSTFKNIQAVETERRMLFLVSPPYNLPFPKILCQSLIMWNNFFHSISVFNDAKQRHFEKKNAGKG